MSWLDALLDFRTRSEPCVLVTIIGVKGSAPRDPGTKMLVGSDSQHDSIGGGTLEFKAVAQARLMLNDRTDKVITQVIDLGPDRSQCCGGQVTLIFELQAASPVKIVLFGAGHVGTSVVDILSKLNCNIEWFDSRENIFPVEPSSIRLSRHAMESTVQSVEQCDSGSLYLVMTHSHDQDFELVEAILSRGDALFCGLIASSSKASSFRSRLKRKQFTEAEIALLTAPVGLTLGVSKEPMAVAVSIVAQLLDQYFQSEPRADVPAISTAFSKRRLGST